MRYVHATCSVVATLALCTLTWYLIALIKSVQVQVPVAMTLLENIQQDTTRTEAEMIGVLNTTRKSMLTPQQEKELVGKTSTILDNVNKSVLHLDDVLTESAQVVPTLNQGIIHLTTDADTTVRALHPILDNTAKATQALAETVGDPSIHSSLVHIDNTTSSMEGVANDAKTESDLIVAQTQKSLRPKNKALAVLQFLGGGTISIAELYYYLTH